MNYGWKRGCRVKGDANAVGQALEQIQDANDGVLTAPMVVGFAAVETSPLHPYFEWNNVKAAKEYRLEQARHLMRSVVVNIQVNGGEPATVRAFVCVSDSQENRDSVYLDIQTAFSDDEDRDKVLQDVLADLDAVRHKLREYEWLSDVFAKARKRLDEIHTELEEQNVKV